MTTSANIVSLLHTFFDEVAIRQFKKNTFMYQFAGIKRHKPQGSNEYLITTINSTSFTANSAILQEGVTPTAEPFTADEVKISPKEYGAYCTLTNLTLSDVTFSVETEVAFEFGRRMAEVVDLVVQNELNTSATRKIYGDGSVNAIANITSAMKLTYQGIAVASANLRRTAAPSFDGGGYVAVIHPFIQYDLMTQTTVNGSLFDAAKYGAPERLFEGEVGNLAGVRIVVSPNIAAVGVGATSQDIYPVYFLGLNAYAIVEVTPMSLTISPRVVSDSDPLAQRAKV